MSEWKEYKLGEVLVEKGYIRGPFGSTLRRDEMKREGIPVYEQQHAIYNTREFRFFIDDSKFNELSRFVVNKNDLIVSCSGTLGKVSIIKENDPRGIISQALLLLRPDTHKIFPEYLLYFFKTVNGFNQLVNASHGSVQQNIASRDVVENIPLSIPDKNTQRGILAILSSLDDKIDLLHRQNKTLEALAETLFRQWFVEEAEEGWERGAIEDEFDFTMGQSPPGSSYNEEGKGMVFFQGRTDFGFRFPEPRVYTTDPKRLAKKFDTLISVRAPVGDINMAMEECCLGRGVAAFRYKYNPSYHAYTYYKLRSLMAQIKQFEDSGTVFGSINKDDFKKLENVIPPKELIQKFQAEAGSLDEKIISNTIQIKTLTRLRDTLLPKLMSGEVRVKEEKDE